ncbi:MAG: hypothetical protein Q7J47_11415 [Azoarcus sp.]|nr:hypothetical protein [Azoarcus sp.]
MKPNSVLAAILTGVTLTISSQALAAGPWSADQSNTSGWQLMTPEERTEHQAKMRSFKTYDECNTYQQEQHAQMEPRAKEKGLTLPAMGSGYGCDNMKMRGILK